MPVLFLGGLKTGVWKAHPASVKILAVLMKTNQAEKLEERLGCIWV